MALGKAHTPCISKVPSAHLRQRVEFSHSVQFGNAAVQLIHWKVTFSLYVPVGHGSVAFVNGTQVPFSRYDPVAQPIQCVPLLQSKQFGIGCEQLMQVKFSSSR